jgi:methyl-accepting chemotaxis protein
MLQYKNLPMLIKIGIIPFLSTIGFGVFFVILWNANSKNASSLHEIQSEHFPVIQKLQRVIILFEKLKKGLEDAAAMANADTLTNTQNVFQEIQRELQEIGTLKKGNHDELKQLKTGIEGYYPLAAELAQKFIDFNVDFEKDQATIEAVGNRYTQLNQQLEAFRKNQINQFETTISSARSVSRNNLRVGLIVGFSILGLVLAATLVSMSLIKKALNNLNASMKEVAQGEGDLTKTLNVESRDELGELTEWFNRFLEKVRELVSQIALTTEGVAESGSQLTSASQNLTTISDTMAQQSNSMSINANMLAQNMQTMTGTTEQVSHNAQDAAQSTGSLSQGFSLVVQEVQRSQDMVNQATELMGETQNKVNNLRSVV